MNNCLRYFFLSTALVLLSACATVTETGRRQLLLITPGEETQLGLTEFAKVKQSTPVSRNVALNAQIQHVGQRIAAVATLPNAQWEFVVFDDPKTVNAFCLPGGKVGVYTGILPITMDELGLATIIGHEVAHAAAHHGGERMSQALVSQVGGQLLAAAMKDAPEKTLNLWMGIYGLTAQVGWVLPHSRMQESEADHIGLLYMARAGYDPRAAVELWKRFQVYDQQHGGQGWEFLSTHPLDSTRVKQLEGWLPQALVEYQKSGASNGSAPDLGKTWSVADVQDGKVYFGIWTRQGDSNTFVANWRNRKDGPIVTTDEVTIESISGNSIVLFREGLGRYAGTIETNGQRLSITGTKSWGEGMWIATIQGQSATAK